MAYFRHDNEQEKTKARVVVAVAGVVDQAKRRLAAPSEEVPTITAKDPAGAS